MKPLNRAEDSLAFALKVHNYRDSTTLVVSRESSQGAHAQSTVYFLHAKAICSLIRCLRRNMLRKKNVSLGTRVSDRTAFA